MERLRTTFFVRPQSVYDRTQAAFKRDVVRYDEGAYIYICPNRKMLRRPGGVPQRRRFFLAVHGGETGLQPMSRTAKLS